ncbi:type II secretion system protein GspM [Methylocaldum szegediense]|uniref:General secretion pathway protein M n=1 Tax=Methylocaldum szegediense TaxID=73780 RepID=A0ABM9I1U7_9GAMM|nr:type II secretion system protein GspM [Methylocaldum szegediense]CAI8834946.1 general secretion pathway protein M [Methylocaldum szegediense]
MKSSTGGSLKNLLHLTKPQLLALGLLVGVIALFYLTAIAPLVDTAREYRETVDELRFRLQRYQKVAAEKDDLLAKLEQIKAAGKQDERFIARDTAALASADLQSMVKEIVSQAGGELTSTQVIPERKEENFTRIAVKIRVNGSTDVLREVLHSIETAKPMLFVENLNIRPIRMPRNIGGKPSQPVDKLSFDCDVIGYMQGN